MSVCECVKKCERRRHFSLAILFARYTLQCLQFCFAFVIRNNLVNERKRNGPKNDVFTGRLMCVCVYALVSVFVFRTYNKLNVKSKKLFRKFLSNYQIRDMLTKEDVHNYIEIPGIFFLPTPKRECKAQSYTHIHTYARVFCIHRTRYDAFVFCQLLLAIHCVRSITHTHTHTY